MRSRMCWGSTPQRPGPAAGDLALAELEFGGYLAKSGEGSEELGDVFEPRALAHAVSCRLLEQRSKRAPNWRLADFPQQAIRPASATFQADRVARGRTCWRTWPATPWRGRRRRGRRCLRREPAHRP